MKWYVLHHHTKNGCPNVLFEASKANTVTEDYMFHFSTNYFFLYISGTFKSTSEMDLNYVLVLQSIYHSRELLSYLEKFFSKFPKREVNIVKLLILITLFEPCYQH